MPAIPHTMTGRYFPSSLVFAPVAVSLPYAGFPYP
jgi:hypothetical protein